MKFTRKDLLKAMNLKIGDKIKLHHEIFTITEYEPEAIFLKCFSTNNKKDVIIEKIINTNYEKIEQKIWTLNEIEDGDKFWYIDSFGEIESLVFINTGNYDKKIVKNSVTFIKEKYAQEYLKELNRFNEKYKKENGVE